MMKPIMSILGFIALVGISGGSFYYYDLLIEQRESLATAHEEKMAAFHRQFDEELEELATTKKTLAKDVTTLQKEGDALRQRVDAIRPVVDQLEDELAKLDEEKEEVTVDIAEEVVKKSPADEQMLRLLKQIEQMKKFREHLLQEFKTKYTKLKQELRQQVDQNDPDRLYLFFVENQRTAFGPAALFFAADGFVRKNRLDRSERYYERLIRDYPDSAYAEPARKRLAAVEEMKKPRLTTVGFHPYKIKPQMDFGSW